MSDQDQPQSQAAAALLATEISAAVLDGEGKEKESVDWDRTDEGGPVAVEDGGILATVLTCDNGIVKIDMGQNNLE